jgi:hypothetical protein
LIVTVKVTGVPDGSTPLKVMTTCCEPLPATPVKLTVVDAPGAKVDAGTDTVPCDDVAITLDKVVEPWLVTGTDTDNVLPGVTVGVEDDVTATPFTVGVPTSNGSTGGVEVVVPV